jgi:hypothetical protein
MNNYVKIAFLSLYFIASSPLSASATMDNDNDYYQTPEKEQFDWTPIMEAIIKVESEGNPNAVSGNSVGAMQITPILVKECNKILDKRKSDKRFSLNDRYSIEKSKEMFLLIQSHHNKTNDVERAIRSWNGGPCYSTKSTDSYFRKVMRHLK